MNHTTNLRLTYKCSWMLWQQEGGDLLVFQSSSLLCFNILKLFLPPVATPLQSTAVAHGDSRGRLVGQVACTRHLDLAKYLCDNRL